MILFRAMALGFFMLMLSLMILLPRLVYLGTY